MSTTIPHYKRTGLLLGAIILTIAVAIICWQALDMSFWVVPCVILVGIGAFLISMSFVVPRESRIGPSASSYYMVNGVIIGTIGVLGFVKLNTDLSWWIIVAIFMIVIAVLLIVKVMTNHD
ncbi:MAG: hypothetical protein J6Y18_03810 [Candidatus Methanomethylophilaceae archaeon]|nr:hypothetical protein [Candidatus Methanomethylophilaceae archaeon]